jgi:Protein of unknown function (DUF4232)/Repeat of unknown function (DUF346)
MRDNNNQTPIISTEQATRSARVNPRPRRLRWLVAFVVVAVALVPAGRASADGSLLYSGWSPLGGVVQGAPAVTTWGGGRVDVFVRGSDNNLWHTWNTPSWSVWENLGAPPGGLASDPGTVAWSSGRIDVFAAGVGGQLWHKWYAGSWSGWENLGGVTVGAPTVSSWGPGRLDVFVRGSDNQLWHRWYASGWSGWEPRGGALTSSPAAVSWGAGRIDVIVRGTDLAAWHVAYDGGWTGFDSLGGGLADSPGVSSWGVGRLDVFATGTDNRLYHQWYDGGPAWDWSGWQLGQDGTLTSGPAAVSPAFGDVEVFGRGTDQGIWHTTAALPAVQCSTSTLNISLGQEQGAAGNRYDPVVFVNTSPTACYLNGYPGVSFVDNHGNQIGNPAVQVDYEDYGPVPLPPGGSAQALLHFRPAGLFDPSTCGPVTPAGIRVYPPGSFTSVILPYNNEQVCSSPTMSGFSDVSTVYSPTVAPF